MQRNAMNILRVIMTTLTFEKNLFRRLEDIEDGDNTESKEKVER